MAIDLKKRPCAHALGGSVGLVAGFSRAGRSHLFKVGSSARGRWPSLKNRDACYFRQGFWKTICPFSNRSAGCRGFASGLDQELTVVRIGKKLNLVNSVRHTVRASHLPEGGNGAINQRRTYRTLFNRKQFVRVESVIAERELRRGAEFKPCPVAVVPGRRRMNRYLCVQFELGNTPKILLEDRCLDLKLMLVAGVLIMASATALEIRTVRFYSL